MRSRSYVNRSDLAPERRPCRRGDTKHQARLPEELPPPDSSPASGRPALRLSAQGTPAGLSAAQSVRPFLSSVSTAFGERSASLPLGQGQGGVTLPVPSLSRGDGSREEEVSPAQTQLARGKPAAEPGFSFGVVLSGYRENSLRRHSPRFSERVFQRESWALRCCPARPAVDTPSPRPLRCGAAGVASAPSPLAAGLPPTAPRP